MQVAYVELHEMVDRLTPDQAHAVREIVRHLVTPGGGGRPKIDDRVGAGEGRQVRRLSFAGLLHSGRGDLAARSEDVIRSEFGRSAG